MTFLDSTDGLARSGTASQATFLDDVQQLLAAAEERDAASDARDASAEQRDRELDLADMLDVVGTYGDRWPERRAAVLDRQRARDDRAASRKDRLALARILSEREADVPHRL